MDEVILPPIKERPEDFDAVEIAIRKLFKELIYLPLLKEVNADSDVLRNATDDLINALLKGRIQFDQGRFFGKFDAATSRELRKRGAKWDARTSSFRLLKSRLSTEIKDAIAQSAARFDQTVRRIDKRLEQMLPEEIADKLKVEKLFDTTLWKTDRRLRKSMENISVTPKFTDEARARIAKEYSNNMKLYIKDWTESEIKNLRKKVQAKGFQGFRYEGLIKEIQKSYGVSLNKAKFLARQETSLLMTKFKYGRYQDAGVNEYIWTTVAGSPNHPVRPAHKKLAGKRIGWNNPPITSEPGEPIRRNHPGQDFNCRCFARPVVKF